MTRFPLLIIFLFIFTPAASAQLYKVEGTVKSSGAAGKPLSYANLRVGNTLKGTSANSEGSFQINLGRGKHRLIASCLGYISDSLDINVSSDLKNIEITLDPISIQLPEVTIVPGRNPALGIIENAIRKKHERLARLESYEYEAYTKGVIRSDSDVGADEKSASITLGTGKKSDPGDLKINAIFENQSRGFFQKPDNYKEIILARKQTSNLSSTVNAVTGGRVIQNFYSDDLRFFNRPMTGPLSDNALKYYYFRIDDTSAIDSRKVFKIYFEPDNLTDPGFQGYVYITDKTFDMVRIEASLNRAANTGGIFQKVTILQQFVPYTDNLYMPIDYRLFIRANILGLATVGFELSSVLYNYKLNEQIDKGLFNKAILTVVPDADKKDSSYWNMAQSIPNTMEELTAYRQIDSAQQVPETFWDKFSSELLTGKFSITDNLSLSGPLGLFHFNRVEGWAGDIGIFADDMLNKRLNADLTFSYGFSDKKPKQTFSSTLRLGRYRTHALSLKVYNRMSRLFSESDAYNEFSSTLLALLAKYDFRDYYYSSGFELGAVSEIFPVLKINAGYMSRTDKSAVNHSDFSIFARDKKYRANLPVNDLKVNAVNLGFTLDFRNFIEDGYFRRRVSEGKSHFILSGGVLLGERGDFVDAAGFTMYDSEMRAVINTFGFSVLNIRLHGAYSDGPVPFQMQYALAGNITSTGKNYTFRTVGFNDVFGDRVVSVNIEHNFRDEVFRFFRIPLLTDIELQLNTFFNAAWTDISPRSRMIMPVSFTVFEKPLLETGFSISHVLFPIGLEFAWRLTHRENNRFVIGLNTIIL